MSEFESEVERATAFELRDQVRNYLVRKGAYAHEIADQLRAGLADGSLTIEHIVALGMTSPFQPHQKGAAYELLIAYGKAVEGVIHANA